jgi:hypothetical protein
MLEMLDDVTLKFWYCQWSLSRWINLFGPGCRFCRNCLVRGGRILEV